jgi:hypothetical protein
VILMFVLKDYTRRHAVHINWYASLLGAAGLGYLLLHKLEFAIPVSMALVFWMACTKVYLFHLVDGQPFVPRGKSAAYMAAWWVCFGLLAIFLVVCSFAFLAVLIMQVASRQTFF